jgi:uncharacterized oligopeptide transporter (OPT) family protein
MADETISGADYVDVTKIDSKEMNKIAATHVISQEPYDAVSHNTNIGDPAFIGSGILIGLNSAISIFVKSFLAWGFIGPLLVHYSFRIGKAPISDDPKWSPDDALP